MVEPGRGCWPPTARPEMVAVGTKELPSGAVVWSEQPVSRSSEEARAASDACMNLREEIGWDELGWDERKWDDIVLNLRRLCLFA